MVHLEGRILMLVDVEEPWVAREVPAAAEGAEVAVVPLAQIRENHQLASRL